MKDKLKKAIEKGKGLQKEKQAAPATRLAATRERSRRARLHR